MPFDRLNHYPTGSSEYINDPAHAKPGIHPFPDRLHVLTVLFNPLRWRSRYNNFNAFRAMVEGSGAILYVCEIAFGGRAFEITDPNNPRHLQLRTTSEIWLKEAGLNLLLQRLPPEAKYIAWLDSDIAFAKSQWAQEILHLLQHYRIVQCFSQIANLGPQDEKLTERGSFMWNYVANRPPPHSPGFAAVARGNHNGASYYGAKASQWNHTGFAWAARKEVISSLGGFIDWAILGSADYHQATAFIEKVEWSLNDSFPKRYRDLCYAWQERCKVHVQRNVGYMPGLILHAFHGTTKNRMYKDRWKLLARTGFDPDIHLTRDWQGLLQLSHAAPGELRDGLMAYNRSRDEDSTDTAGML